MRQKSASKLTLDNPYSLPLLFAIGGIVGFVIFEWILDGVCVDRAFALTFVLATAIAIAFLVCWGARLEKTTFHVEKLPAFFLVTLAIVKIYLTYQLIQSGAVDDPDLRLQAFGNSTLIMLSGAASSLFFPIGYFASPTRLIQKILLATFFTTTVVDLSLGASKSAVFGLAFTALLFAFLKRKQTGDAFPFALMSKFSLALLSVVLFFQIALGVLLYGHTPMEFALTLVTRAVKNFDGAIYGCMVENYAQAPNSFFTYTFLPILKRLDPSYYELDYFNVPQWLLFEVLGISREGRFGFPNDNLYTALYFGGFQYFSLVPFLLFSLSTNFIIKKVTTNWHTKKCASPIQLSIVFSIPLAFASIQEFVGLLLFYLIFKIVLILHLYIAKLVNRKNLTIALG